MGKDLTTDSFAHVALALPDQVREALANVDCEADAAELVDQAEAMAVYARRIRADTVAINAIQLAKLLSIAKLAEFLPGHGGPRAKGEKQGIGGIPCFSKNTSRDYRKIGDAENRIEEYVAKITEHNATLPEGDPSIHEMSMAAFIRYIGSDGSIESVLTGNVEWYTPALDIAHCRTAMGGIDLDPASNDKAQEVVKADRFYTEDDNGLEQPWWGRVFCNPPYKMPLVKNFAEKLCEEYQAGTVKQAVFLTDSATDTHWWQEAAKVASVVCFTEGRIKFYNPSGVGGSPTRGQSFMYFGKRLAKFREQFKDVGILMKKEG